MGELNFPFTKKLRTTEELIEDNERLKTEAENEELRLSIAQKQALYKKLENAGLTVKKDFNGSLKRAWQWLNKTK
jgi:hypothetical protein